MKKRKNGRSISVDIFLKERKDWNGINPVTKIIPNKKHKKPKYKNNDEN